MMYHALRVACVLDTQGTVCIGIGLLQVQCSHRAETGKNMGINVGYLVSCLFHPNDNEVAIRIS